MKTLLALLVGVLMGIGSYHLFGSQKSITDGQKPQSALSYNKTDAVTDTVQIKDMSVGQQSKPTNSELELALLQLQVENEGLRTELLELRKELREQSVNTKPAQNPASQDTTISPQDEALMRQWTEEFQQVKTMFDSQSIDYDWSYEIESKFSEFVLNQEDGDTLHYDSFSCRVTLCELTLTDTDIEHWTNVLVGLYDEDWWQIRTKTYSDSAYELGTISDHTIIFEKRDSSDTKSHENQH